MTLRSASPFFEPASIRAPASVRQALAKAGFNGAGLAHFLRQGATEADRPLLTRRARQGGDDPFYVAVRLFLLGEGVSGRALGRIFDAEQTAGLLAAGILRRRGARWFAAALLAPAPAGDLFALSDFTRRRADLSGQHVLGIGAASETLAALTPRRRFARALDLGCGAGVQALLAAAHCERVTGVDIHARALHFAAANARLNDLYNIEWLAGDFFAPVAGRRFNLLVANPPFVISPENEMIFRTGSAAGDGVSERVVREAPIYLEENGLAIILVNWGHRAEDDWPERPVRWLTGNGCDAWLLRFRSDDPLAYAAEWLRNERVAHRAYGRALDAWTAYYRRLGIGWVSAGAVVLRRRSSGGPNWLRCDALAFGRHAGPCGAHLERVIAGETWAQTAPDDDAVLGQRFQLHPDHALETHFTADPGNGWNCGPLTLRPSPGLTFAGQIDAQVMQVLGRLDGRRTLGEAVALCAAAHRLDFAAMAAPCAAVARKLLRAGLLVCGTTN